MNWGDASYGSEQAGDLKAWVAMGRKARVGGLVGKKQQTAAAGGKVEAG